MDGSPNERPAVLKFGIVAFASFVVAASVGVGSWLAMRNGASPGPLRYVLGPVFGIAALVCLFSSGLGALRYLMAFAQRPRQPGETLGFVLSIIPLVAGFIAIQVAEISR